MFCVCVGVEYRKGAQGIAVGRRFPVHSFHFLAKAVKPEAYLLLWRFLRSLFLRL